MDLKYSSPQQSNLELHISCFSADDIYSTLLGPGFGDFFNTGKNLLLPILTFLWRRSFENCWFVQRYAFFEGTFSGCFFYPGWLFWSLWLPGSDCMGHSALALCLFFLCFLTCYAPSSCLVQQFWLFPTRGILGCVNCLKLSETARIRGIGCSGDEAVKDF